MLLYMLIPLIKSMKQTISLLSSMTRKKQKTMKHVALQAAKINEIGKSVFKKKIYTLLLDGGGSSNDIQL